MNHLIAAEWLKLTKRPLTRILLAIFVALLLLQIAAQFIFASMLAGVGTGSSLALQVAEYQRRSVLPGIFGTALGHLNGLGGIFAVILTAGAMGSEYSWGTLRTQLARRPDRARFLIAKALTILLLLLLAGLVSLVVAGLLGILLGSLIPTSGSVVDGLAALPLGLLRALFVLLPYVLLTLCFTIAGRSLLAGVAGGLVYLVLEGGFGAVAAFAQLGGIWRQIYNLTIGQNINTLVLLNAHAFGLQPEQIAPTAFESLPSPLQAVAVVLLYSASFFVTALYLLRKRDIGGAG
ncbi:MAG: ABC transporter permease [Roseiflexaceae bacterium]|nr:ABC transporter permease [Roseiflexaceae bacterium]